jgi:hypothetical protein
MRSIATTRARSALLAAGTAAAAAVGGVTLAVPANAASDAVWDRLAQCESGGNWQINTGNGFYGGVQFSHGSWHAAGGGRFAAYPHQASRVEQIWTAERLLDLQGWGAWPACSAALGLGSAEAAGTPRSVERVFGGGGKVDTDVTRGDDRRVLAGADITSRFVVRRADGRRLAGARVTVCSQGVDLRSACDTRRTDRQGVVEHRLRDAARTTRVWVRYDGDRATKAAASGRRTIAVAPRVRVEPIATPATAAASASRTGTLRIAVGTADRGVRIPVVLQRKVDGAWQRAQYATLRGLASVEVAPGKYRARTLVAKGFASTTTDAVRVSG